MSNFACPNPPGADADLQRLLPQSPDAELGLLSSFLNAPDYVGPLCRQRGLRAHHFHVPGHALVFDWLARLQEAGEPIDFITLTERLRAAGVLGQAGGTLRGASVSGAAFICEIFTFLPTATNAEQYAAIVEEKHTLREIIQVCTEYAARSYTEQDNVPSLLGEVEKQVLHIAQTRAEASFRDLLGARAFNLAHPPPEPTPLFRLGSAIVATPGNLLAIQAKAKAGKSAFVGALLAATMKTRREGDCLGVTSGNERGLALIHFDTEQSPWDHHQGLLRVLRRAGRDEPPPWLRSYRVADLSLRQRREAVALEMQRARQAHGGILAVLIDGIGDLCADPNDPEEALALIDEMHRLAIRFDTVVACVLHENPGTEIGKTRGHLGSQLERKAETNLRLEKDTDGVTVVFAERARHAHIAKEKGPRFAWNDEAQMHTLTQAQFKAAAGASKRDPNAPRKNSAVTTAKTLLGRHFAHDATVRRAGVLAHSGLAERTFDKYWAILRENGWIRPDKLMKGLWTAAPTWAEELACEYPEEMEVA
jgi:replicative DNA helicase